MYTIARGPGRGSRELGLLTCGAVLRPACLTGKSVARRWPGSRATSDEREAQPRGSCGGQTDGCGRTGPSGPPRQDLPARGDGKLATWRWACVVLTQLVYYGTPWLSWHGRQAVLFDLSARKVHLFGLIFWPHGHSLPRHPARRRHLLAVSFHRRGRTPVVRLRVSANGLHRDVHVDRAEGGG